MAGKGKQAIRFGEGPLTHDEVTELEKRIGYHFHDIEEARLLRALTHSSVAKQANDISHYERLEFVGDRVLGLVIAEMLFFAFPEIREGELSVRLNALVKGDTCAEVADEIGLHEFIRTGVDTRHITDERMRSVRADAMEAIIASIYIDGGLDAAKTFIDKFWETRISLEDGARRDAKTALQEWAHAERLGTPVYETKEQDGPDHEPVFTVAVLVNNEEKGVGSGSSKRKAEKNAATAALMSEGVWPDENLSDDPKGSAQ